MFPTRIEIIRIKSVPIGHCVNLLLGVFIISLHYWHIHSLERATLLTLLRYRERVSSLTCPCFLQAHGYPIERGCIRTTAPTFRKMKHCKDSSFHHLPPAILTALMCILQNDPNPWHIMAIFERRVLISTHHDLRLILWNHCMVPCFQSQSRNSHYEISLFILCMSTIVLIILLQDHRSRLMGKRTKYQCFGNASRASNNNINNPPNIHLWMSKPFRSKYFMKFSMI